MNRQSIIPQLNVSEEGNFVETTDLSRHVKFFESNDIESEAGNKMQPDNNDMKDEIELKVLGFDDHNDAANMKVNVFKRHKYKFVLLLLVCLIAILAIYVRVTSDSSSSNGSITLLTSPSLSSQLAASKGTSIPMVTIIPSKASSEVSRRLSTLRLLANDLVVFPRRLSAIVNPPNLFDELSDYNLMADPSYLVGDRSTEVVSTINLISCMSSQLRIKDVGLNTSFNPNLMPFSAVVDVSKCSSDQQEIMTWYVKSNGPDGMGDGNYKSNMIFRGFGSELHITLKNTVANGVLKHSSFAFESAQGENKGILIIDNTATNETDVTFFQEMSSMTQWMHVKFNPETFVGKAITKSPDGGRYALDFDYDAINRLTNSSSGETSTACIDFSVEKKILVADRYSLFNAIDGSKVNLVSGFNVETLLTLDGSTLKVQLWCSFWGLWASGTSINNTLIDSSTILSHITNGMTVTRMDYKKKQEESYTLTKKTARLNKVTRRSFSLEQMKGLVLKINSPGKFDGVNIVWNGSALIEVGRTQKQCLYISDYNSRPSSVSTDFIPTDWSDCGCLDTEGKSQPYSKRSVGPYGGQSQNKNPPFYQTGEIRTVLSEMDQVLFTFTSTDFSSGIQVSTNEGNMNGIINVEYVPLQIIHGMRLDVYNIGDLVTQEINGIIATGEVYKATESFLYGFSCKEVKFEGYVDNNNLLHVLTPDAIIGQGMQFNYNGCPEDCMHQYWGSVGEDQSEEDQTIFQVYGSGSFASLENPVNFTSSYCFTYFNLDWNAINTDHYCAGQTSYSSGVEKGALLTQGSNMARTTTSYWSGQQDGIGYVMITGSGFNTEDEITISSDGFGDWSNRGYNNIEGSFTAQENQLENQWTSSGPSVTFKLKENGVTSGCQQFELQSLPGSNGKITVYGYTNGLWWAQVTEVGTTCTIANENVYDISIELPLCEYEITYACRVRIENKSTQIIVKLPSKNANRFEREHDVNVNGNVASQYVYWIEDAAGEAQPLTESSILSYQTQTLVADDDFVPNLLCYDNCPAPISSVTSDTIDKKSYPSVLNKYVQITNSGKCDQSYNLLSVDGYDVKFDGFVVAPKLNITFKESTINVYNETTETYSMTSFYSISSVIVTDLGIGCDKDLIDVTFNSTIQCSEVPALQLSCNTNGDFKDFRNANHYHFDSTTGLLVDDDTGFTVEIGADGTQSYFGNFFEGSSSNKNKLLCDWDKTTVCSWKSFQVLDEYYTYDTGPYSAKISLIDDNNKEFHFQQPIDLVATFSNPVSASGRDYNEASVLLNYQGDGGLSGLPQVCLNQNMIPGQCDYDSTSYADINISPTQILRDLDGNRYYAKAAIMNEYYPIASDPSICSILQFADLPSEPDISIFDAPENMNQPYPTEDDLKGYLNKGLPVVISGITVYEL